jgi:hypothetical protein
VSEWLVGGARSRGYANLTAIKADFLHVVALTTKPIGPPSNLPATPHTPAARSRP